MTTLATVSMVPTSAPVSTPNAAAKPMAVVFRKYREGDVIAMICGTARDCNAGNVMSYQHVGQHGEASRDLGRSLKLATPEEYKNLKRELEGIYKCPIQPVHRLRA